MADLNLKHPVFTAGIWGCAVLGGIAGAVLTAGSGPLVMTAAAAGGLLAGGIGIPVVGGAALATGFVTIKSLVQTIPYIAGATVMSGVGAVHALGAPFRGIKKLLGGKKATKAKQASAKTPPPAAMSGGARASVSQDFQATRSAPHSGAAKPSGAVSKSPARRR